MSDPYADAESGLQAGALVGQSVTRGTGSVEYVGEPNNEGAVAMRVASQPDEIATTYAFTQIVSAKLWRDEAQRESFVRFMAEQPTSGFVRTDAEHRSAASFGALLHDVRLGDPHECGEQCTIWPSTEEEATHVMIRVEVNVRKAEDDE